MVHALRRLRFELGDLTLAQFSECTSLGTGVISRIENRKRGADLSTVKTLAAQFSISLDQAAALCDSSISEIDFVQLVVAARAALAERFRGGSAGEKGTSDDAQAASQGNPEGAASKDSAGPAMSAGQCESCGERESPAALGVGAMGEGLQARN